MNTQALTEILCSEYGKYDHQTAAEEFQHLAVFLFHPL